MENMALLGTLGCVCSIAFGYVGYQRGLRKEGAESGEIKADVRYIRQGVDDIRIDLRAQETRVGDLSERVTRVEESAKQAHKRIDELKA